MVKPPVVLVVDDAPSLRLLCRVNLELEGYRVLEAGTLAEAAARPPAPEPNGPNGPNGPNSDDQDAAREAEIAAQAREALAALLGMHLAHEPRSVEFLKKLRGSALARTPRTR